MKNSWSTTPYEHFLLLVCPLWQASSRLGCLRMSRLTPFYTPVTGTRRRVYISGPMSGIPGYNAGSFNRTAYALRKQGYAVCSPVETSEWLGLDLAHEQYLRFDFERLLEADFVMVLDGWETSKGALAEILMATSMGLKCWLWSEWLEHGTQVSSDDVSNAIGRNALSLVDVGGVRFVSPVGE